MTKRVRSYLSGQWVDGEGDGVALVNPTTEDVLARSSTKGLDFGGALAFARKRGGRALRELSFEERGALLKAMSRTIHEHRDDLIQIAVANGGNTRSDAKFDIDGASYTLAAYARLAKKLGDRHTLVDGDFERVGRSARFVGGHVWSPLPGVNVQINAFNFPAWGFGEKAACALLAGMPVVAKPAPATALLTERLFELLLEIDRLPTGVVSLIAGEPGDLLAHVEPFDVVAFTGSAKTGAIVRGYPDLVAKAVRVNVEADSVNAAVLGLDVEPGEPTYDSFITEVAREITQKAGQKCTAIRRILVPEGLADTVANDLSEMLGQVKVGDPALREVSMGPLVTKAQLDGVQAGLKRLRQAAEPVFGDGGRGELTGVDGGKGFFVSPVLLRAKASGRDAGEVIHDEEVFGPVSTILPYSGDPDEAASLVNRGGGSLVAALYSDKRKALERIVHTIAPYHGRIYINSKKVAGQTPGSGGVHPMLVHGGPGRAGGGEELGGLRGLSAYMQRTALQGDKPLLDKIFDLSD